MDADEQLPEPIAAAEDADLTAALWTRADVAGLPALRTVETATAPDGTRLVRGEAATVQDAAAWADRFGLDPVMTTPAPHVEYAALVDVDQLHGAGVTFTVWAAGGLT